MAESKLDPYRSIKTLLPYTTVVLVAAMAYAAWTLWSRHSSAQRALQEQQAVEARHDADITRRYGNGNIKILSFYASPGSVRPGEKALLCYGVSNAKTVTIEPAVDGAGPSISRCLEIHPRQDTQYTLTAADGSGHEVHQSLALHVGR